MLKPYGFITAGAKVVHPEPCSSQFANLCFLSKVDDALVKCRVKDASYGTHTTDNSRDLNQEVREAFAHLRVFDGHGREVVPDVQRRHLLIHNPVCVRPM